MGNKERREMSLEPSPSVCVLYLRDKMENCVTEKSRRPQGNEEGIEVVVVGLELLVLSDGYNGQSNERSKTHKQYHQEAIAVCWKILNEINNTTTILCMHHSESIVCFLCVCVCVCECMLTHPQMLRFYSSLLWVGHWLWAWHKQKHFVVLGSTQWRHSGE